MFTITDSGKGKLQEVLATELKDPGSITLEQALERVKQIDTGILIEFAEGEFKAEGAHNVTLHGEDVVESED